MPSLGSVSHRFSILVLIITTYIITDTIGEAPLIYGQQSAGASSEENSVQNMNKGHSNTDTPNSYIPVHDFPHDKNPGNSTWDVLIRSPRRYQWTINFFHFAFGLNPLLITCVVTLTDVPSYTCNKIN